MSLQSLLLVGVGGFFGSACRFALSGHMLRPWSATFPFGTLAVNVLGSLAMGYVLAYLALRPGLSDSFRPLVVVGFLGGFTTFSAFSAETLGLLQSGHLLRAGLNVGLSVALCLIAAALGFGAATWLHQTKGV